MTGTHFSTDERSESEHVCVFCGAIFDASERTTCPSCEAEVVLRGPR